MVGIVLVSHSRALAVALADLVRQVSTNEVAIAISAGVGDDRQEFGTDAIELMEAIQSVYSVDGVLVLMDLGSAVLSAETALELLPEEISAGVRLCPAPFVEGAIAAAVLAGLDSDLDTVFAEARAALAPKLEQIEGAAPIVAPSQPVSTQAQLHGDALAQPDMHQVTLTIRNLHGLHARPAARFVKTAASFDANIQVRNLTNGKGPVTAKSLNALATLGAVKDHQVLISASGAEAERALEMLSKMIEEGFGEAIEAPASPSEEPGGKQKITTDQMSYSGEGGIYQAIAISEGIAVGPFYRYQPPLPEITNERISDPQADWERLQRAISETGAAIRQRQKQLAPSLGEEQAAIFEAHELILSDPDLLDAVKKLIFTDYLNAAAAWLEVINQTVENYRSLDDLYLKQRAIDVMDVGRQVLFTLSGKHEGAQIHLTEPVILYAEELTPTETSSLDMSKVLGLMTVGGGPTSHSAILARALGIPAVSGVSTAFEAQAPGTIFALDGFQGLVWVDPSADLRSSLEVKRQDWLRNRQRLMLSSQNLALTADGRRVEVVANVGSAADARSAAENGAEGIGLLRTEFLFLTRTTPPSEEEQYQVLHQIGEAITQQKKHDWPILVRTLDVGGDKELPYVQLAPEANPFLGVRALRLSLRRPELFLPQLRAILRAGADFHYRMMFPMVANLDEILQARQYLHQAHQELTDEKIPHGWPIEMGIMVEIPSAALLSPLLAEHVEFFSIGTNDLTQYTLAAERGNPLLSGLADALHPAVLRLVGEVASASHKFGKWTGVCGELAGDPLAVPVLVGLGVDELSMNPGSVPRAKAILSKIDTAQAVGLAESVLAAPGAVEARAIARQFYEQFVLPKL